MPLSSFVWVIPTAAMAIVSTCCMRVWIIGSHKDKLCKLVMSVYYTTHFEEAYGMALLHSTVHIHLLYSVHSWGNHAQPASYSYIDIGFCENNKEPFPRQSRHHMHTHTHIHVCFVKLYDLHNLICHFISFHFCDRVFCEQYDIWGAMPICRPQHWLNITVHKIYI